MEQFTYFSCIYTQATYCVSSASLCQHFYLTAVKVIFEKLESLYWCTVVTRFVSETT